MVSNVQGGEVRLMPAAVGVTKGEVEQLIETQFGLLGKQITKIGGLLNYENNIIC